VLKRLYNHYEFPDSLSVQYSTVKCHFITCMQPINRPFSYTVSHPPTVAYHINVAAQSEFQLAVHYDVLCPDEQWGPLSTPATTTNYYELIPFFFSAVWCALKFSSGRKPTAHPRYYPHNIHLWSWWISILWNNCLESKNRSEVILNKEPTFHISTVTVLFQWSTEKLTQQTLQGLAEKPDNF